MRKSDRIYALAGALVFHLVLLVVFVFTFMEYPPAGLKEWPPQPEHEIVFEEMDPLYASGDFVRTGDNLAEVLPPDEPAPSDVDAKVPAQDAVDLENAGKAATPKKTVTSEKPSPGKVQKKKTGPTKDEIKAEKERQEARRQQQAKKNVENATKKAFGGGKGKSTPGVVEGKSESGATTGTPGNGLKGRSLESWTTLGSTRLGVIVVRVKVDAQGHVVSASYDAASSSGPVATDAAMRRNCVARSRECRFSVLEGSPVQSGTISWVFK